MEKKKMKYIIQRLLGRWLSHPSIPKGKTYGYSLVRSESYQCVYGKHTKLYPPFYLNKVKLGDYSYIAKNPSRSREGIFHSFNFCCKFGKIALY